MYLRSFIYKGTKTKLGSVCRVDQMQSNGSTLRSPANFVPPPSPTPSFSSERPERPYTQILIRRNGVSVALASPVSGRPKRFQCRIADFCGAELQTSAALQHSVIVDQGVISSSGLWTRESSFAVLQCSEGCSFCAPNAASFGPNY